MNSGISVCTRYTSEVACRSNLRCGWCTVGTCSAYSRQTAATVCARPYTYRLPLGMEQYQRLGTNIKGVNSLTAVNGVLNTAVYSPYASTNRYGYNAPNADFAGLMYNRQQALNKYAYPNNSNLPLGGYAHQGTYTPNADLSSRRCELSLNRFQCLNTPNCGWCHQTTRCTAGNEYGPSFEFCPNEVWEYVLKDTKQHVAFNSGPVRTDSGRVAIPYTSLGAYSGANSMNYPTLNRWQNMSPTEQQVASYYLQSHQPMQTYQQNIQAYNNIVHPESAFQVDRYANEDVPHGRVDRNEWQNTIYNQNLNATDVDNVEADWSQLNAAQAQAPESNSSYSNPQGLDDRTLKRLYQQLDANRNADFSQQQLNSGNNSNNSPMYANQYNLDVNSASQLQNDATVSQHDMEMQAFNQQNQINPAGNFSNYNQSREEQMGQQQTKLDSESSYNDFRFKSLNRSRQDSLEDLLQTEDSTGSSPVSAEDEVPHFNLNVPADPATANVSADSNSDETENNKYYGLDQHSYFKFKQMVSKAQKASEIQEKIKREEERKNYIDSINKQLSGAKEVRMLQRNNANTAADNSTVSKQAQHASLFDSLKGYLLGIKPSANDALGNQGPASVQKADMFKMAKFLQNYRKHQTYVNPNPEPKVRMEWDPKKISDILARGEEVAVPKDELNIIMKNIDYSKLQDQVIETLDYE